MDEGSDNEPTVEGGPLRGSAAASDQRALRVLMIDDSMLALEVQLMMLERRGYEARGCLDLDEVAEAAEEFCPDVVVTDVGLGDVTVEDACEAIRAAFGNTPILLYSGQEDHILEKLAAELGVSGFINKADERKTVYAKIERAVERAAAHDELQSEQQMSKSST